MCKRDKIIEKIKALLNMTTDRGCSEAEALSCALKAQKLIAEYDIDKTEIYGEEQPQIVEAMAEQASRSRMSGYLAEVISRNFRCEYAIQIEKINNNRKYYPVFVGYSQDARAAALVYEKLYRVGNRLANKAQRQYKRVRGLYKAYFMHFIDGVAEELDKQCEALMLVIPLTVKEFYDAKDLVAMRKPKPVVIYSSCEDIYQEALNKGRDAVRMSRMEGDTEYLLNTA